MKSLVRYFTVDGCRIPIYIDSDGTVNIGATGEIKIEEFINLASSVVRAYNIENGTHYGFNEGRELD